MTVLNRSYKTEAGYWRGRARVIRNTAEAFSDDDARLSLLAIAADYESLAGDAARHSMHLALLNRSRRPRL